MFVSMWFDDIKSAGTFFVTIEEKNKLCYSLAMFDVIFESFMSLSFPRHPHEHIHSSRLNMNNAERNPGQSQTELCYCSIPGAHSRFNTPNFLPVGTLSNVVGPMPYALVYYLTPCHQRFSRIHFSSSLHCNGNRLTDYCWVDATITIESSRERRLSKSGRRQTKKAWHRDTLWENERIEYKAVRLYASHRDLEFIWFAYIIFFFRFREWRWAKETAPREERTRPKNKISNTSDEMQSAAICYGKMWLRWFYYMNFFFLIRVWECHPFRGARILIMPHSCET